MGFESFNIKPEEDPKKTYEKQKEEVINAVSEKFTKKKESGKEDQESKEKTAEEISEKRGGLFSRIIKRFVEERESGVEEIVNMSEDEKRLHGLLKKIPVLRGYFVAAEGLSGAEPGKELNTKESLVKIGTGALMFTSDILKVIGKEKTGEEPENVFKGKTLDWLENKKEESKESNPESKSTKVLEAVHDFLKENEDTVSYYEDRLNEVAEGKEA